MIFDPILDLFRGKAVTIPPMDGAFRPNTALDEARVAASLSEPDTLLVLKGKLHVTAGNGLHDLSGAEPAVTATFPAPVTAAAVYPDGALAIALSNGTLLVDRVPVALPAGVGCITALAFQTDGTLWLANGSARLGADEWARDLMTKGATGSVWYLTPGKGWERALDRLAWPSGLATHGPNVVVSEAWRHRLLAIGENGHSRVVASRLPGYPGRMSPAADGGSWLSIFAPMNRLIQFVLQEDQYRIAMIEEIDPAFWIAPQLRSGASFLEPLQCGAIRTMGIHKPWSPSRSYGLVVKLDGDFRPQTSLHSRANGSRHGITSAVELNGTLYSASRGGDVVLANRIDGEAR